MFSKVPWDSTVNDWDERYKELLCVEHIVQKPTIMDLAININSKEGILLCNVQPTELTIEPSDELYWTAEGSLDINQTKKQLYQSMKAIEFLLQHSTLTLQLILDVHRIMMKNSDCPIGFFRSSEVRSGEHQFISSDEIISRLQNLIIHYNLKTDLIDRATYVFYEMITIHPFTNGNGRLCRLFFAWSLFTNGFPYLITLDSGHKRHRSHYLQAIQYARRCHRGELNTLALVSMLRVIKTVDTR